MKPKMYLRNFMIMPIYPIYFSAFPVYVRDTQLLNVTIDQVKDLDKYTEEGIILAAIKIDL